MTRDEAADMFAALGRGDESAAERLLPLIFDELRAVAAHHLRGERRDHTLQPTALVHEAYLRLVGREDLPTDDRDRFMRVASRAMRRVLVDHARTRDRLKRGGGWTRVALDGAVAPAGCAEVDLVALSDALDRLAAKQARLGEVVELRFFGGLTVKEIARLLGVSETTVDNDWFVARAWLARELDTGTRS